MKANNFIRKNPDGTPYSSSSQADAQKSILGNVDLDQPSTDIVLTDAQSKLIQVDAQPFPLVDESAAPFTPIADQRIERFLMLVVENGYTKPNDIYRAYKSSGFQLSGIEMQDKNSMRFLMAKPRVKDRWNYLKESEWELSKPTKVSLKLEYEKIIDDPEIRPADRLRAIDGLVKLLGLCDSNVASQSGGGTTVIFNSIDKPKIALKNDKTMVIEQEN